MASKLPLLLLLLLRVLTELRAQCPFPGLPANGHGRVSSTGEVLSANYWRHLSCGEAVVFTCDDSWRISFPQRSEIKCLKNGTWDAPVPRCGATLIEA